MMICAYPPIRKSRTASPPRSADLDVTIHVCGDTLAARKLDFKKDLYDVTAADLVPSGVAEIARLQMLGYAYVKP
jgi:intracellular sulfur oxidation DsrE/DsrF family protein